MIDRFGTAAMLLAACLLAACTPMAQPSMPVSALLVLAPASVGESAVPVLPAATRAPVSSAGAGGASPSPRASTTPSSSGGSGGSGGSAPAPTPTPTPPVLTIAGSAASGFVDGLGTAARFDMPSGVAVDAAGTVYVADRLNHRIRQVDPDGRVTTLAGTGVPGYADGPGETAQFDEPVALAVDAQGTLYVADSWNHRVRAIVRDGAGHATVSTVAGGATAGARDGDATSAQLDHPVAITTGGAGELFVVDSYAQTVRRIRLTPTVAVSTLAGSPYAFDHLDGTGADARFLLPVAIAHASDGNLYVVEEDACYLRRITPSGEVTTLIGVPTGSCGAADGPMASAQFNGARGLAADEDGHLYMADTLNGTIRMIDLGAAGGPTMATFAGVGPGDRDGALNAAEFDTPMGLAVDAQGRVIVAQAHAVRRITR